MDVRRPFKWDLSLLTDSPRSDIKEPVAKTAGDERMIRVLIADDHRLVRQCLRALLERDRELQIIGEAGDGHEVLQVLAHLVPDLVLLDIQMPGLNGLKAAEIIREQHPRTKIVIVTMLTEEDLVLRALKLGVHGYIIKHDSFTELAAAVHAVMSGETFLSSTVSSILKPPQPA